MASDVDFVMLSDNIERYAGQTGWAAAIPLGRPLGAKQWGVLTEQRFRTLSGLEVDFGVVGSDWARIDPVDEGSARVGRDGMVALHDPTELLAALAEALSR